MLRGLGIAACLGVAMAMPVREAVAQDAIGGAIIGGVGGAIVGGALGGGRGAAIGAVVGAGTGAAIASEGERRRSGYYAYQRGCYTQRLGRLLRPGQSAILLLTTVVERPARSDARAGRFRSTRSACAA